MTRQQWAVITYLIVGAMMPGRAATAESMTYDAATGNYHLSYECEGAYSTTIEPHNKLAPAIESSFSAHSGGIAYSYNVALGTASLQPLEMISLDPIQQVWDIVEPPSQAMLQGPSPEDIRRYKEAVLATAPSGWRVIHFTNRDGTARVGWSRVEMPPSTFTAGSKQAGFRFSSRHLPGVFAARFLGDGPGWNLPCEGPAPGAVADALDVLRRNDHVPRFVAAPIIRVPHPFDAVVVVTGLRSHVSQIEQWGLADAPFAAQIRGYLSEALNKLEAGDVVGGAAALGKLRVSLRSKYPSLDSETAIHAVPPRVLLQNPVDDMRKLVTEYDRVLAARVLDFDVGYVTEHIAPVTAPSIVPVDCNSPPDDTICAPTHDPDGTFIVRWGAKSCPKQQGDSSCELTKAKYRLERSQDSKFFRSSVAYEGAGHEFQVTGAAPGVHYFRVTADYSYCVKGYGLGYTSDYCDEDQHHWQSASDTYAAGPNKTAVDAP